MGNEVTKPVFGGVMGAQRDLATMADKAAASASEGKRGGAPDGSIYANFSGKRGVYEIGSEKTPADPDERWLVNVQSFEDGWTCWKGGAPTAIRMWNIYDGVPTPTPGSDDGGPFDSAKGEGWFFTKALVMRSLDDEGDEPTQIYFKNNSVSGVAQIAELQEAFTQQVRAGQPAWPVVQLDKEKFTARGFTNYKPVLKIVEWLSDEEVNQIAEGEALDDILEARLGASVPPAPAVPARARRRT